MKVKVNNIPNKLRSYVVARVVDAELWYFATFDKYEDAKNMAIEVDGLVLEVEE